MNDVVAEDVLEIAKTVSDIGFNRYILQQFKSEQTLDPKMTGMKSPKRETMLKLGETAKSILPKTKVYIVTQENGFEEIKPL